MGSNGTSFDLGGSDGDMMGSGRIKWDPVGPGLTWGDLMGGSDGGSDGSQWDPVASIWIWWKPVGMKWGPVGIQCDPMGSVLRAQAATC